MIWFAGFLKCGVKLDIFSPDWTEMSWMKKEKKYEKWSTLPTDNHQEKQKVKNNWRIQRKKMQGEKWSGGCMVWERIREYKCKFSFHLRCVNGWKCSSNDDDNNNYFRSGVGREVDPPIAFFSSFFSRLNCQGLKIRWIQCHLHNPPQPYCVHNNQLVDF